MNSRTIKKNGRRKRERKRNNELKRRIRRRKHRNVVALRRLFTVAGSNVWRGWAKGRLLRPQITQDQRMIPRGTLSRSVPNSTSVDRKATQPATPSWRRVAILPTVALLCSATTGYCRTWSSSQLNDKPCSKTLENERERESLAIRMDENAPNSECQSTNSLKIIETFLRKLILCVRYITDKNHLWGMCPIILQKSFKNQHLFFYCYLLY